MAKPDTGRLLREITTLVGDADRDGLPDGQLLARFVDQRDEAAFDLLTRRYGRLVFGVCRRVLADRHSAEDAFQATFLVLVHKAGSLDRRRPVADWLYTVAFRLACRARANAARRREKEAAAARTRTAAAAPTAPDDTLVCVHEELNRLPERHRVPLVLSYLEGRTYEQVARAIGCPLGSVGHRLSQARDALRDRLAGRGIVCPAAGVAALITSAAGAAVPAPLYDATIRAGLWFAGEQVGTAAATAGALQLARGALGAMTTTKLAAAAAGVVLTIGLCGGTAWVARSAAMADPPPTAAVAPDPAPAKPDLPAGVTARLGTTQFRHGESVVFIAYPPDGQHLVTAGRDNLVILWERATGREVRRFEIAAKKEALDPKAAAMPAMPGPMARAVPDEIAVALSPDGKTLAAGRGAAVTVWDVPSGKRLHGLTAPAAVIELLFTPDGKSLVGADSADGVTLWDPATGKEQKTLRAKAADGPATVIKTGTALSPAGTHLVHQLLDTETANGVLRVFDLAAGEAKEDIKLSAGGASNLAFSPDGKRMAWASFLHGVTVWDVATHREVTRFGQGEGMKPRFFGQSIGFSADGKTLAVTLDNDAIELWDVAEGKSGRTIGGHPVERGGRVAVRIAIGAGGRMTRNDLAFSPDGKTVAASLGNATVRQYDTAAGTEVAATPGHLSGVMAVGSDGRSVVSVSKESVRVWDAAGREVRQWPLSPPAVAATVSADAGRVATSAGGGVVHIWDAATGRKVRDIETKRPDVAGVAFSADGKLIATKAELNSAVNLWDAATGAHVRTLGQDGEPFFNGGRVTLDVSGLQTPAVAFSPDGRLVAAAGDRRQLRVWDVATGTPVCEIPAPAGRPGVAFGFSGNGHVVGVLFAGGGVAGYEVATGEKRFEMNPAAVGGPAAGLYPNEVMGGAAAIGSLARGRANAGGLAFTPDGRFVLAATGGPAVRAWDTLTGQEAALLTGHRGSVSGLRVGADGRSLVSGSVDTTALVWDLTRLPRLDLTRENPMAAADIEALWADLAKPDPAAAFAAARKLLTDRRQAAVVLKDRLRPVPAVGEAKVAQLVADLGGSFEARRAAAAELERLGELAAPQLRKALAGDPPLDLRQRVERLLEKVAVGRPQGDQLRELRAVELLELAATPEAREVLATLAKGAPAARLTREAGAALARLNAK